MGVLEGEVVANEPAAGGAEHDDVAAGGHGGDDAVAPRSVALQRVHGEQLSAAGGIHGRRADRSRCESGLKQTPTRPCESPPGSMSEAGGRACELGGGEEDTRRIRRGLGRRR